MKYLNKILYSILLIVIGGLFLVSCTKQNEWLKAKRELSDVTPKTLADYQAILDQNITMNTLWANAGLLRTDNVYIPNDVFNVRTETEQHLYSFSDNVWANGTSGEWNNLYKIIEWANVVLDGLKTITPDDAYDNVKGQALFFRAYANYTLAHLFCPPYEKDKAATELGLPLRLSSDVNTIYKRSTLQQTYDQINKDAEIASQLLSSETVNNYSYRPTKVSAYGLLAKISLVMGTYKMAEEYADTCISLNGALIDFNNQDYVSKSATYPFPYRGLNNPEIIFFAVPETYLSLIPYIGYCQVDTSLYNSYDKNDLRKSVFYTIFNGIVYSTGSYSGYSSQFCGIANNEIYLIKAECEARNGDIGQAMNDLNTLLRKRYLTGTYIDKTATTSEEALNIILAERRKELPFVSNIRWEDLRRLNLDPNYQITVIHEINGMPYSLSPNDPHYVLPIPENEIQISHLQQNKY